MTDEERRNWKIEGGWIPFDAFTPGPADVVEWIQPEWNGPMTSAWNDLPAGMNMHGICWRRPRAEAPKQPAPGIPAVRIELRNTMTLEDRLPEGRIVLAEPAVVAARDAQGTKLTDARHRIIHAWHAPDRSLCALGSDGSLWRWHPPTAPEWVKVTHYPPGLEPVR